MANTASGNLYVIAAPSGTGKTTLVKALADSIPQLTVSISHTTRPKRPGEVDGINYYFIDRTEFEHMIRHQDFLEHAIIFDNYYGTSKSWVQKTLAQGLDVILEIDWQGHRQIKKQFPDSISIFILPPSLDALRSRLVARNQDSPAIIERRLADTKTTVSHLHEFDYIVINDDFSHALRDLTYVIQSGRLLEKHQTATHAELLKNLEKFATGT
jgi:guanylate kinase